MGKNYSAFRAHCSTARTLRETKDKIAAASLLSAIEYGGFCIFALWLCGLRLQAVERIAGRKLREPIMD